MSGTGNCSYSYDEVYLRIDQVAALNYPLCNLQDKRCSELSEPMGTHVIDNHHDMKTVFFNTDENPPETTDQSTFVEVRN